MRILATDLVDLEVLAVDDVLEVVVGDEVDDAIRGDVPGSRDPDVPERLRVFLGPADDLDREEEAAALSADLSVARGRTDDPLRQLLKIGDRDEVLRDADELDLVGEEPPDKRGTQVELNRTGELAVVERRVAEASESLRELGKRRPLVLERLDEESGPAVLDPALDAAADLGRPDVSRCQAEDLLGDLQEVVEAPARHRPVLVGRLLGSCRPRPAPREAREETLRLLDAAHAEEVQHSAGDRHVSGPVDLAEEVDDDPPVARLRRERDANLFGVAE